MYDKMEKTSQHILILIENKQMCGKMLYTIIKAYTLREIKKQKKI